MRLKFLVSGIAVLLAAIAAQNSLLDSQATNDPTAATTCAPAGPGHNAVQGECTPSSLDSSPAFVSAHTVLEGACAGGDLHVVRYAFAPADDQPAVATWCK